VQCWQVKGRWTGGPIASDVRLQLDIRIFFKTRGKRDLDNFNKLVLDSMAGIVFVDDSQIDDLRIRRGYDAKAPRWRLSP
jgi:Holliday junction resolvase RusA-like endonuclease